MKLRQIGYIAAVEYNSEGKLIEWEYGSDDLVGYGESPHMFKTEKGAMRHLNKFSRHPGRPYVRKYYEQV